MARGGAMHVTRRPKNTGKTLKRLLGYIFRDYKLHFGAVVIFIVINSVAGVMGSMFIQRVIDDYITPMLQTGSRDFAPLIAAIFGMLGIYAAGVVAGFLYNRIMIVVGQGILKDIRDEMFCAMQRLPISYFDTHSHGDTMSRP